MKLLVASLALCLASCLVTSPAGAARTSRAVRGAPAAAAFESLKKLVGVWDADMDADGKSDATVRYELTGGGSVLQETLFEGTDHEMVTMYHLNGDELWLTHYRAAGNQPRMRLVSGGDEQPLVFALVDVTGMESRDDVHMGRGQFTLLADDHVQTEWTAYRGRETDHVAKLDLTRRKG